MGSSFILSLPSKENQEIEHKQETEKFPSSHQKEQQILVVEDNRDMQNYIQEILAPHFNISLAEHGKKALDLLKNKKQQFDLIITDLMMPLMNGMELLEAIRSDEELQKIPVIILSALSEEKIKLEVISIGIDDYVSKPFISDELLASIKNCLQNLTNRQSLDDTIQNNEGDLSWLKLLRQSIIEDIDNQNLTIGTLAQKLYVSERQLYREIQRITGMTPLKYLKEVRLQHARILLETEKVQKISQVSYACGFGTVAYFSRLFEKRFGKKPSSYFS